MEPLETKCSSYINNRRCANNIETGHTWCTECSKFFIKKQLRYKAIEIKYYSEEHIVPQNSDINSLIKIYSKLSVSLSLRRYISEYGYYPELRDVGHRLRIENISRYKKMIKAEMSKLHSVPKKIDISEIPSFDDSDRETEKSIKITENKQIDKVIISENDDEELIKLDTLYFRLIKNNFCNLVLDALNIVEHEVKPKLGKNFWTALCLQYVTMKTFCDHKTVLNYYHFRKTDFHHLDHSCYNPDKMNFGKSKFLLLRGVEKGFKKFVGHGCSGDCNNICKLPLFEIFIQLRRQIPLFSLPKGIKRIIYDPTDEDIENLTPLNNDLVKCTKNIKFNRNKKINLLRNKIQKNYNYDLQSCMRTNALKSEKLACVLSNTDDRNKYKIMYATDSTDSVFTESSIIDVSDYYCTHTFTPIIVLDESIIFVDQKFTDYFASIFDNYVDVMKSCCVLLLESHTKFLFTF
jgi:hypothetical protein